MQPICITACYMLTRPYISFILGCCCHRHALNLQSHLSTTLDSGMRCCQVLYGTGRFICRRSCFTVLDSKWCADGRPGSTLPREVH